MPKNTQGGNKAKKNGKKKYKIKPIKYANNDEGTFYAVIEKNFGSGRSSFMIINNNKNIIKNLLNVEFQGNIRTKRRRQKILKGNVALVQIRTLSQNPIFDIIFIYNNDYIKQLITINEIPQEYLKSNSNNDCDDDDDDNVDFEDNSDHEFDDLINSPTDNNNKNDDNENDDNSYSESESNSEYEKIQDLHGNDIKNFFENEFVSNKNKVDSEDNKDDIYNNNNNNEDTEDKDEIYNNDNEIYNKNLKNSNYKDDIYKNLKNINDNEYIYNKNRDNDDICNLNVVLTNEELNSYDDNLNIKRNFYKKKKKKK